MDVRDRANALTGDVSEALAGTGIVVDDITVQQAGRRRLVRIFVARDVSGLPADDTSSTVEPLTLDEIAEATRIISAALDDSDAMGEAPYTLEVSSPGIDRPLTTPDAFRRNVGRLVELRRTDDTRSTGRLVQAGPDGIVLDEHPDQIVTWDDVASATVQVEFSRTQARDRRAGLEDHDGRDGKDS